MPGSTSSSAEPEALVELGEALLRDGVAAYLPTLITGDLDDMLAALRRIAALGEPACGRVDHRRPPRRAVPLAGARRRPPARATSARPIVPLLERLLARARSAW